MSHGGASCTGGFHAVAEALSWRTQRRRRHACADMEKAAALVKGYLDGLPKGSPAQGQMPTLSDLAASGNHDVRYALQVRKLGLLITALGEAKLVQQGWRWQGATWMACRRARQRRGRCQRCLISPRLGTAMCGCTAGGRSSTLSSSGSKLTSLNTSAISSGLKVRLLGKRLLDLTGRSAKGQRVLMRQWLM